MAIRWNTGDMRNIASFFIPAHLSLSALLQLHLHSRLNTWLQWIGQYQLQDETRNIKLLGFGAPYIWRVDGIYNSWVIMHPDYYRILQFVPVLQIILFI